MSFWIVVVEGSVSLASMNVIADEFFQSIGDGGVIYNFFDEGDDIDGVESLGKVYCYENCSMRWSFLIEASDNWVDYGV